MVKVSVIIPVYNVENYIEECLESVMNQSYPAHEVIVINDGSTDKSPQILNQWADKYKGINVIHMEKNSGAPGGPRNIGISMATGDYLHFMDPDDYIDHDYYEKAIPSIEENEADIIITNIVKFNSKRQWAPFTFKLLHLFENNRLTNLYTEPNLIHNLGPANKLFKRNFLLENKLRFLEGVAYEDVYFTTCCFYLASKIYVNGETTYYWRRREDENNFSITQQKFLYQSVRDRLIIHRGIDRFLEEKGLTPYRYIKDIRAIVDFNRHSKELYAFTEEEQELFFKEVNTYLDEIDEQAVSFLPNPEYDRSRFFFLRNQLAFELIATSSLKYGQLPFKMEVRDNEAVPYFDFSYLKGKFSNDHLLSEKLRIPRKLIRGYAYLTEGRMNSSSIQLTGIGSITYVNPVAAEKQHATIDIIYTNRRTKEVQKVSATIQSFNGNKVSFTAEINRQNLEDLQHKKDIIDIYVNINIQGIEKKIRLSAIRKDPEMATRLQSPSNEMYITNKGNISIKTAKQKCADQELITTPTTKQSNLWKQLLSTFRIGARHP
ncbi:MAG: glycosyltransferase family 2 protein [Heyndrickxia sp.]